MMADQTIGVDLGGTHVRAGIVTKGRVSQLATREINAKGSVDEVLNAIFHVIDALEFNHVHSIGIGVPSIVDTTTGMVYDVQNIPSWKEVPLKSLLEDRYKVEVFVNNDANCLALAEKHFGYGKDHDNMVGLNIGTGLAAGIIINGQLYEGINCGAGELGMIPYLDHNFEYYTSGQFFSNVHGADGEHLFQLVISGHKPSLAIFQELGHHLGHLVTTLLFAYDPSLLVIAGSVGKTYPLYHENLWQVLKDFPYQQTVKKLQVQVSTLAFPGILGAGMLTP